MHDPRSVGARVIEIALVPQFVAGLGMFGSGVVRGHDVIATDRDTSHRWRLHRKRLSGRILLAGRITLRNRALFDREDRLAGNAIEDKHVANFTGLHQRGNLFAVVRHVHQHRLGRQVEIPQFVVDGLEIPLQFAGSSVGGNQRVREEIVAGAIASVVVRGRPAERHVNDAELFVHGYGHGPDIRAAAALPAIVAPRVVTLFAWLSNGVEIPELFTGAGVVRAGIAGNSGCDFVLRVEIGFAWAVHVCSDDDDVFVNRRNLGERDVHGHFAALAEFRIGLAGFGAESDQFVTAGEKDARAVVSVARPIRHASRANQTRRPLVGPDYLAGFGLEREHTISG